MLPQLKGRQGMTKTQQFHIAIAAETGRGLGQKMGGRNAVEVQDVPVMNCSRFRFWIARESEGDSASSSCTAHFTQRHAAMTPLHL